MSTPLRAGTLHGVRGVAQRPSLDGSPRATLLPPPGRIHKVTDLPLHTSCSGRCLYKFPPNLVPLTSIQRWMVWDTLGKVFPPKIYRRRKTNAVKELHHTMNMLEWSNFSLYLKRTRVSLWPGNQNRIRYRSEDDIQIKLNPKS